MVHFDEATHTYTLDGEVLPSVTQILRSAGMVNTDWCTDFARDRGTAVHAAIHLDIANKLDEDSVDPEVRPYLEQWRQFKKDTGVRVLASEKLVWSDAYGYAGTLDLYCQMHGRNFIIDFKSNTMPKSVDAQLGGYSIAMRTAGYAVHDLAALILKPKTYKLACFERDVAESEFMSALTKAKGVAA